MNIKPRKTTATKKSRRPSALERLRDVHIESVNFTISANRDVYIHVRASYKSQRRALSEDFGKRPDEFSVDELTLLIRAPLGETQPLAEEEWPRLWEEFVEARRRAVLAIVDAMAIAIDENDVINAHHEGIARFVIES